MKKDKFDKLRDKTNRIVEIGLKLVKSGKKLDLCSDKCASCLSAKARGIDDKIQRKKGVFGLLGMFDSSEDVCMLEARDILAKKLKWNIN